MGRDLAQLRFVAEGTFEHREAARHRDDVQRCARRVAVEFAACRTRRQRLLNQNGDARDEVREGLPRLLVQPLPFGRAELHQAARGRTSPRRRAGAEVADGQVEERGEALSQGPRAKRLLQRRQIFGRVAPVGDEEQRFLAAEGIVETAALDAGVARDVRQRRATHPPAPKLIERDAQDVVFGYGLEAGAKLLPIIGFFGIASGEFILCEGGGDLGFGRKGARKTIYEAAPRGV